MIAKENKMLNNRVKTRLTILLGYLRIIVTDFSTPDRSLVNVKWQKGSLNEGEDTLKSVISEK